MPTRIDTETEEGGLLQMHPLCQHGKVTGEVKGSFWSSCEGPNT